MNITLGNVLAVVAHDPGRQGLLT